MTTTLAERQPASATSHPSADNFAPAVAGARLAFVAPRFAQEPQWKWITTLAPMNRYPFERVYIDHVFKPLPKATALYRAWQHARAARVVSQCNLTFLFSTDIGMALTKRLARRRNAPRRIYVGFTQDGPWTQKHIDNVATALQQCDRVTLFTEAERQIYLSRYGLTPEQAVVAPIHTDETEGYQKYPDTSPRTEPFALALGSPNRRFTPTAQLCRQLGIPLVIITRPWHETDSLDELAALGATIVTDADKLKSLTYLKHARLCIMPFLDPDGAGGFTTLIHAMFLRTPFVATNCLGIPEHVIDGETGFVTPHDDRDALRDAIERLWNQPGLAERFGEASFQRAQQRHSLQAAADRYYSLANEVLRG